MWQHEWHCITLCTKMWHHLNKEVQVMFKWRSGEVQLTFSWCDVQLTSVWFLISQTAASCPPGLCSIQLLILLLTRDQNVWQPSQLMFHLLTCSCCCLDMNTGGPVVQRSWFWFCWIILSMFQIDRKSDICRASWRLEIAYWRRTQLKHLSWKSWYLCQSLEK